MIRIQTRKTLPEQKEYYTRDNQLRKVWSSLLYVWVNEERIQITKAAKYGNSWTCTTSLGKLFQCVTIPAGKKVFTYV